MNNLNQCFTDNCKNIIVGELTDNIINCFNLNRNSGNIILWYDRLKHIEDNHRKDFKSYIDYCNHINQIFSIIKNPEYVGLNYKNNSLEFIKRIEKIMLVAVRIKNKGNLNIRSAYPISEAKFNNYLHCGKLKQIS